MALTVKLTPGYVYTDDELDTAAKRNALGNPTIELEGAISSITIANGSVTTAKLADGALSNDTAGHLKMQDGYLSANPEGWGKMQNGYVTAAKLDPALLLGLQQGQPQYGGTSTYTAGVAGAAGVYAVALSPAPASLTVGMRVAFLVDSPNTTATAGEMISVNGLTPVALQAQGSIPLMPYQLMAGEVVTCVFDGSAFQIENGAGRFTTAELVISLGLIISTFPHNLGIAPSSVRWVLRCHTSDAALGYSAGDEVDMASAEFNSGGFFHHAFLGGVNGTNLFVVSGVAAGAGTFSLMHKTTGATGLGVTNTTNWRIVGYLRR